MTVASGTSTAFKVDIWNATSIDYTTRKNLTFARLDYNVDLVPCQNGVATIVFRVYPKLGETDSFYLQDEIILWKQEAK